MTIEIKSPTFPESVADGTVANWVKKEGDSVAQDEILAEIETDKVVLEVVAPSNGVLTKIIKNEGDIVNSAEVIGKFDETSVVINNQEKTLNKIEQADKTNISITKDEELETKTEANTKKSGPAAKKLIVENNLDSSLIKASGKDQRITKADVINHLESSFEPSASDSSSINSS